MDEGMLRAAALGGFWTAIDVVASTGSTNADLLARATREPEAREGQVLVAEEQTAGRGRLGRTWTSMPGAALTFSVLLRPVTVPSARRGWLPLMAGVAVASAVRSVTEGGAGRGRQGRRRGAQVAERRPGRRAQAGGHPRRAVTRRVGGGDRHRPERGDTRPRAAGLPGWPAGDVAACRGRFRVPRVAAARDTASARTLVRRVPRRPGSRAHRPARRVPPAMRDPGANGPG